MAKSGLHEAQTAVEEAGETLTEEVGEQADALRERLEEIDIQVRSTVQQHPLLCLFGALLGGYAVGRIIARR